MVRRELRKAKSIAKKIVPRETLKRIRKVRSKHERLDLYKHSLKSYLDIRIHNLEKEVEKAGRKDDVFHLIAQSSLLSMKIRYFYVTHDKKDFKEVLNILKDIEKELKVMSKPKKRNKK